MIRHTLALLCAAPFALAQESTPAPSEQDAPKQEVPAPKADAPAPQPAKPAEAAKEPEVKPAADPYVLNHTMKDIDGVDQPLSRYKGKVLLIVNVASRCGFTPQYEKLEKLYQAHKDAGLVVIGVPANNFLGQEPGSNAEIKEFCSGKYGVTFPLMAKVSVKGDDIAPLYKQLTEQASPIGGEITWNFNKFVVDRSGRVVARFDSRTSPEDPALVKRITDLLAASPEAK